MKKLLSLLLVFCMLASMMALLPVVADEAEGGAEETPKFDNTWIEINDAEEFMKIGSGGDYPIDGKYYLAGNINFKHDKDTPTQEDYLIGAQYFTGVLDGNGFSLLNINITNVGNCSIFGCYFGGTLQNITIGADGSPAKFATTDNDNNPQSESGSAAAIAATGHWERKYTATFKNVTVYAEVSNSSGRAASFVCYGYGGAYLFENCKMYGSVKSTSVCAAGFLADGNTSNIATFINCENHSTVEGATSAAGFFATNAGGGTNEMTFDGCTNYGNVTAAEDAAGFFAKRGTGGTNTMNFSNCANRGTINSTGKAAAGFYAASSTEKENATNTMTFDGCTNYGNVTAGGTAAAGFFTSDQFGGTNKMQFYGCANFGNITGSNWRAGGIVGQYTSKDDSSLVVDYCFNAGNIKMTSSAGYAAGIVGGIAYPYVGDVSITNVYNVGAISNDGNASRAYEIVYSSTYDATKGKIANAYYLNDGSVVNGGAYGGVVKDVVNVSAIADADALLAALQNTGVYGTYVAHGAYRFVASTDANYAYPVLVKNNYKAYSESTAEWADAANCTISSDEFTAFYSDRTAAIDENENETAKDIRLVLAADIETLKEYDALYMNVEFVKNGVVVKTCQYNVETELSLYKSAQGGGVTYTAAEDSALFGLIITDVPNDAWSAVYVSLGTTSAADSIFVAGQTVQK